MTDLLEHLDLIRHLAYGWYRNHRHCWRFWDREDAAQQAYVICRESMHNFDPDKGSIGAFLKTVIQQGLLSASISKACSATPRFCGPLRGDDAHPDQERVIKYARLQRAYRDGQDERTPMEIEEDCEQVREATVGLPPWIARLRTGQIKPRHARAMLGVGQGAWERMNRAIA